MGIGNCVVVKCNKRRIAFFHNHAAAEDYIAWMKSKNPLEVKVHWSTEILFISDLSW